MRNGTPNPREKATKKLYAVPGQVAAKVNIPQYGVQHHANATPNTNDVST
jgi:hypothetical protein